MEDGKNRGISLWRRSCACGGAGIMLSLILLMVISACCGKEWLTDGRELLAARVALALSALLASVWSCKGLQTGRAAAAGVSAGIMVLFVLLLSAAWAPDTILKLSLLWNLLSILCGALAGCLLSARKKPVRRSRRRFSR